MSAAGVNAHLGYFYLLVNCGNCDEEVYSGPNLTLIQYNGLPVIAYDIAAQTRFYCEKCGADNYTGDFDLETEGGSDPDDLESEEET